MRIDRPSRSFGKAGGHARAALAGHAAPSRDDRLAPEAATLAYASPCHRVVYVVDGAVRIDADAGGGDLSSDQAVHTNGRATASAGAAGATLWRCEVLRAPAPDDGWWRRPGWCARRSSGHRRSCRGGLLSDPLRSRRFPLGSQTPKHTHQGPGIRSLLRGEIHAEIGDKKALHRAGEAWFERGPDPVVGRSSKTLETGFVRVIILPRRLLGQSSFQYYDEAERQKPRTQNFQIFIDEPIEL